MPLATDHLEDRLALAFGNAPAQLTAALDNASTVLDLTDDPDMRATIAAMLDDASARIVTLRASI